MGFFDRIKKIGIFFTKIDDEFYDGLEESLILADMGVETVDAAVEELRTRIKAEHIKDTEEAKACLRRVLADMVNVGDTAMDMETRPAVVLFIGVNGVGKTTTIGKLGARYKAEGKNVLLCAADTFRAAAAEQLSIWAERCGVDIVKHAEGADPGAVVFDALSAARARGSDVILVDTAGRLHNKKNLMNELSKLGRIIDRELPGCSRETLLVMDATTGQNGLTQAKLFMEATGVTGIVLTKLDGTAKGGIVLSIANTLKVPVKYVGLGEGIDDLRPFDAETFAEALI
ncbi:Signal recognition particle receptor FtsY [bioreactor metagenome]|uniref:Signal recognition particle receptor FtsY n=1 Tax=bioreactor metagenome TaxID=1076179 RepID=A0A644XPD8_9ZZZZ